MENILNLLGKELVEKLAKYGYKKLTPIQIEAIPKIIFKNTHVMLISPTGSGKTEAALFPIISLLLKEKEKKLKVIYITPLKALNRDIFRRMRNICEELNIEINVRHGDTPESQRKKILKDPPHILIITPESLDALSVLEVFYKHLSNLKFIIIDEIHELIEGKRGANLLTVIQRIKQFKNDFRIICLSATVQNPVLLCKKIFNNENFSLVISEIERNYKINIDILEKKYYNKFSYYDDFLNKINKILNNYKSSIIFTNTRSLAESLCYFLKDKAKFNIYVHHGSLSREIREKIEYKLKYENVNAVIATSSLEHGIDIQNVEAVLQFNSPMQATILKQRIGRSMHRLNEDPIGYIFVLNPLEALESYILSLNANNNNLEALEFENSPLDILIHHIIGYLLVRNEIEINKLYNEIKILSLFENLKKEDFEKVLDYLVEVKLCWKKGDNISLLKRTRNLLYYFDTVSTIFEEPLYSCIDVSSRNVIGKIDGMFLKEAYANDSALILAGKAWKVISINEEKNIAEISPVVNSAQVPIWIGEILPVSKEVACEVFNFINYLCKNFKKDGFKINVNKNNYVKFINKTPNYIKKFIKEINLNSPYIPSSNYFVIESCGDIISIINPKGTKVNKGLSIFLKGLLKDKIKGITVSPYGLVMYLKYPISIQFILNLIFEIPNIVESKRDLLREILYDEYRFLTFLKQVALFFGSIRKEALHEVKKHILLTYQGTLIEEEAIRWFLNSNLAIKDLIELINLINERKIKLLCYETKSLTPISSQISYELEFLRSCIQEVPISSVYDAVEKRLLNEELLFICFACKHNFKRKIFSLQEKIVCYKCGSIKIAAINPYDEEILKVANAFINSNKKILKVFSKEYEKIILSAELIAHYGKIAAFVMAGRGIGPEFARRILSKWKGNKNDLIKEIIEYEINFIRTRKYWN